jgi:hypothetical protein
MPEVIVITEGQTEEFFIKQLVAPSLRHLNINIKPENLRGSVSFDRIKLYARNTLRGNSRVVVSTFIDLYALDTSFPAFAEAKKLSDVYARLVYMEKAFHSAIIEEVGCRPERFLPYIQPYEYEGLLFSDVCALSTVEPTWDKSLKQLNKVCESFASPEHINDGFDTKPSKRLENLLSPEYKKTRHGPLIAKQITLEVIEQKCVHFREWMESLRRLSQAGY